MKKTSNLLVLLLLSTLFTYSSPLVFARGGGGGSDFFGGGGSIGGGSYEIGGGSYGYNGGSDSVPCEAISSQDTCDKERVILLWICFIVFIILPIIYILLLFFQKITSDRSSIKGLEEEFQDLDPAPNSVLSGAVEALFYTFQKSWSEFDTVTLEHVTTTRFYQQLILELNVLKNEHRENRMSDTKLILVYINPKLYLYSESLTQFTAEITGRAHDVLYDLDLQQELYSDDSSFKEFWTLVKENNEWKLDSIKQVTENQSLSKQSIEDFANHNNFFYNPDFGWLMIPNKGILFSQSSFKNTDINNHVIGLYKNKIVEFYTVNFSSGSAEYFIGQAILPKSYNRILVRRRNKFTFIQEEISGLRRIELESIAFNDEFDVYSDNSDIVTTFELLHPAFMEYIMGLPYEVSIEVVGNTIYFYTKTTTVDYNQLLEILSRAFDEIKE